MTDLREQIRLQTIRHIAAMEARRGGTSPAKPMPEPRPKPVIAPRPKQAPRTETARTATTPKPTTVDLPGDELHAIYESLTVRPKGGCKCKARIAEMNKIGSAGCRARFDEIVGWQREGMEEYTWTERATAAWSMLTTGLALEIGVMNWSDPFPALVDLAIKRAEAKLAAEVERLEAARRPFVLNPAVKICVVTGYTASNPTWLEIGRQTSATMRDYCERHGYGFRCHTDDFEPGIHPSWSKIKFLKKALEHHKTVLWIDADALVTNPHQRIEDLHQTDEDISLCFDTGAFNCGVILLRRSAWTTWFLNSVWDERRSSNRLWEQDTINRMLRDGELSGHLRTYPPRTFNSCLPIKGNVTYDWQSGDFIAHVYNTGGVATRKVQHVEQAIAESTADIDESKIQASRDFLASLDEYPVKQFVGRGIVTSAGGLILQLNAYVMLRLVRHLGCQLPIQCWYDGDRERDPVFQDAIAALDVEYIDGRKRGFSCDATTEPLVYRGKQISRSKYLATGCALKAFAVAESPFAEVAWIDADSFPLCDPSLLFDDPTYQEHGSILFPDPTGGFAPNLAGFGVAGYFNAGLETGQMFLDRARTWKALKLNAWYNANSQYFYKHSWTDKDTILAAMLLTGTRLNIAPLCRSSGGIFKQFGPDGEPAFCHRITTEKYDLNRAATGPDWFPHNDICQQFIKDYRRIHV